MGDRAKFTALLGLRPVAPVPSAPRTANMSMLPCSLEPTFPRGADWLSGEVVYPLLKSLGVDPE